MYLILAIVIWVVFAVALGVVAPLFGFQFGVLLGTPVGGVLSIVAVYFIRRALLRRKKAALEAARSATAV